MCSILSAAYHQSGMVANHVRDQLNGKTTFSVSRVRAGVFGPARRIRPSCPVSARSLHTHAESGVYSRAPLRPHTFRDGFHLFRQPPSGQSRVDRVTQLRTDGVHRQESADTVPVVLKADRVTVAAYSKRYRYAIP